MFFFVFLANVSVSISFVRNHLRFYIISVSTNTIVSVNVGSIISVSVIVSVTEISLLPTRSHSSVAPSPDYPDVLLAIKS